MIAKNSVVGVDSFVFSPLRVACFDVNVVLWNQKNAVAAGNFGEFSAYEGVIRVDSSLSGAMLIDTLLHEVCHAVYWAYGIDDGDDEERVCGAVGTGFTQVFRDNPRFLTFLIDTLGGLE